MGAPPKGTPGTGVRAVVNLLHREPWLGTRPDGRPFERVGTKWEWDTAGRTLRLHFRNDVLFHDGSRLTSEIAAESLRYVAQRWQTEAISFSSITDVTPAGPEAVDIHLRERNGFVLTDLTTALITKPDNPNVGTGPFKIDRLDAQGGTLSAFPQYFRGRPSLAGITVTNYPTQRNAWSALMRGDVDMLYEVSREAADFVQAESTVKTYRFPRPYYIPLVFNVRRPFFRDARVRQAINDAIDRATLIRDGMNGRGTVADGPIWPLHWAYTPMANPFKYSPGDARRLLDAAGLHSRATANAPVPIRFSFSCLVFANDSRFERIAVLIQKQLADVGIEMQLVPVPLDQLGRRVAAGDFDAFIIEMAGRSLGWVYYFWRHQQGSSMDSGYHAADAILDRLRASLADDEIRRDVADLTQVLHDDPPAAFLAWQEQTRAVSTKFDVSAEDKRDILTNLWQWRPAAAR